MAPKYELNNSLYSQLQEANRLGFDDRGAFLGQNPDGSWGRPMDMAKQMGWGAYRKLAKGPLAREIATKNFLTMTHPEMAETLSYDPNAPPEVRAAQQRGAKMDILNSGAEAAIRQAGDLQMEGIRGRAAGKSQLFGMRDQFTHDKDMADREAYQKSLQQKQSIWSKLAKAGQIALQVGGAIGLPGFGGMLGGLAGSALGAAGGGGTSSLWGALSGGYGGGVASGTGGPKIGGSTTP